MQEFRYQFQYDPNDLKAIRDSSGVVRFSPATSITVWAAGFSVCLVILGALGAWAVLFALLMAAVVFLFFYVGRLNRQGMSDREYLVRTITITETGVVEEFANSMFEKSWSAFDEFIDVRDHLLLKHYEKITAIPKRAIPPSEIRECAEFVTERMKCESRIELERYSKWFEAESRFKRYRFQWQDADIHALASEKMERYQEGNSSSPPRSERRGALFTIFILIGVAFLMFYFARFGVVGRSEVWAQIALFAIAISLPIGVALLWWKYTQNVMSNSQPKIPTEEICVAFDEEYLKIGYPMAIARYSFKDILAFYISERFIGFRPVTGMIHVIANHAFGGKPEAMSFLKMVNSLRLDHSTEIDEASSSNNSIETGNPFQSPSTRIH